MSRPKSQTIYFKYVECFVPYLNIFQVFTKKCPEYISIPLCIINSEGFMMVEPRILLGPTGLNNIRPKVNIGSRGFDIGRRAEHYMSPKAVCRPDCWHAVERDV